MFFWVLSNRCISVLDTALISGATVALRCTYDLASLQRRDFVMLSTLIAFFRPQMIIWRSISSPWADIQKRHVNFSVSGDTQVTLASKPFREGDTSSVTVLKAQAQNRLPDPPFTHLTKTTPPWMFLPIVVISNLAIKVPVFYLACCWLRSGAMFVLFSAAAKKKKA